MHNKIHYENSFLPSSLVSPIVNSSSFKETTIEEDNTELYYKVLSGFGKLFLTNGASYEGTIENGLMNSEDINSILSLPDGTRVKGKFKDNSIVGKGIYEFASGSRYDGFLQNGLRDGFGNFTNHDKGLEYSGNWKNGLMHGQGTLSIAGKLNYEGNFVDGKRTGLGKCTWLSKNVYIGELYYNN